MSDERVMGLGYWIWEKQIALDLQHTTYKLKHTTYNLQHPTYNILAQITIIYKFAALSLS